MKKILILLVVITSLCNTAFADEILFRGIPWGSSPQEFEHCLYSENTFFNSLEHFDESRYLFVKSEIYSSHAVEPKWGSEHLCYYISRLGKDVDYVCIAGGYEIDAIISKFLPKYNGDIFDNSGANASTLHEVTYIITDYKSKGKEVDQETAFWDLFDKLNKVYGESTNQPLSDTIQGVPIARYWVGDNGTSVLIQCVNFKKENSAIHIEYRSGVSQEYISGLVQAYDTSMNVDGGL